MKLSVVLLNYGTPDLSIRAAESVLPELTALGGALVVVDNMSKDDSAKRLQAWRAGLPEAAPVSLVLSDRNTGYAGGMNLGIRANEAPFVVLLNSDTIVQPGALAAMVSAFAEPDVGLVAPAIFGEDGTQKINRFRWRTPISEFVYATDLDAAFKLFRRHVVAVDPGEPDSEVTCFGFPCVMARRTMLEALGLLDERYFMYFEDIAFCRSARRAGWRLAYAPRAAVVHLGARSSGIDDDEAAHRRLPAYYYDSRARYFIDHYGVAGFVAANCLWLLGRAVNFARVFALQAPKRANRNAAIDIWTWPRKDAQARFGGPARPSR